LNGFLPERIIFFRDGVGDGQLDAVVNYEVPQIHSTFSQFGENYKPRMAVIVVKKRIHTRLFLEYSGKLGNPVPGTVVDSGCTRQGWYDFFLSESIC